MPACQLVVTTGTCDPTCLGDCVLRFSGGKIDLPLKAGMTGLWNMLHSVADVCKVVLCQLLERLHQSYITTFTDTMS